MKFFNDPSLYGRAFEWVAEREGYIPIARDIGDGRYTIGYGRTIGVRPGEVADRERERLWTIEQLRELGRRIAAATGIDLLPEPCWIAILSWAYNVGWGNASKSQLLRVMRERQFDRVPTELLRWTGARWRGGYDPDRLRARRLLEAELWRRGRAELQVAGDAPAADEPAADEPAVPVPPPRYRVVRTDTARGSIATATATAVGAVVPQLAGLDHRVAIAIVLAVAALAVIATLLWRSRRKD